MQTFTINAFPILAILFALLAAIFPQWFYSLIMSVIICLAMGTMDISAALFLGAFPFSRR